MRVLSNHARFTKIIDGKNHSSIGRFEVIKKLMNDYDTHVGNEMGLGQQEHNQIQEDFHCLLFWTHWIRDELDISGPRVEAIDIDSAGECGRLLIQTLEERVCPMWQCCQVSVSTLITFLLPKN